MENLPIGFQVLVSREELLARFSINPSKLAGWLKDPSSGIPVIHVTSVPQFEVGAFMRWLIKNFGKGDWGGSQAGGKEPEGRKGARVVPRRLPLPGKV